MFKLTETFIDEFRWKQPKWGPLGYFTYKRTYARQICRTCGSYSIDWDPLVKQFYCKSCTGATIQSEEFWQTCRRVVETVYTVQRDHCKNLNLPWNGNKAQTSAQEMYRRMWDFKFLPPGRGLWGMDINLLQKKGSAILQNCGFVSTEELSSSFSTPFIFVMDMSMLGVGMGGDTLGVGEVTLYEPETTEEPYVVEDTREGWTGLIDTVLKSFVKQAKFPKNIDYGKIRKKGEPLITFGGVASGPDPLILLVNNIWTVLHQHALPHKITTTELVDIMNYIGVCVVSGNIRRSAEIILGKPTDKEFRKLKQDKEAVYTRRWASNNSILCDVGQSYDAFVDDLAVNGEPGFVWLDNARHFGRMKDESNGKDLGVKGVNPCGEQFLESYELCCLVEVFPSNHDHYEGFQRTLKYAYLYAKTVTLVPTHDARTNAVMMRNRRIGTSLTGVTQAIAKHGRRNFFSWCDKGYEYLGKLDSMYSNWLCVRTSIKRTTIKPGGTIPLLPGVTPGAHYPHSEYYIRNVRVADTSPLVDMYREAGYPVEKDKYSPDTYVISFPVKEKYFYKGKRDVSIWEQMELTAQLQYYWSDNAVSITVSFKGHAKAPVAGKIKTIRTSTDPGYIVIEPLYNRGEAKVSLQDYHRVLVAEGDRVEEGQILAEGPEVNQIKDALQYYETRLKSVSFLPIDDHGYEQAPYIEITKLQYEALMEKIQPVKIKSDVHEVVEKFCDGEACEIPV